MTATLAPPSAPPSARPAPVPAGPDVPDGAPPPRRPWARRLVRGREDDPAWNWPALLALLAATGVLYLWNLAASGYANSFYAAAVQAGSKSWKAWFFGSLDS